MAVEDGRNGTMNVKMHHEIIYLPLGGIISIKWPRLRVYTIRHRQRYPSITSQMSSNMPF